MILGLTNLLVNILFAIGNSGVVGLCIWYVRKVKSDIAAAALDLKQQAALLNDARQSHLGQVLKRCKTCNRLLSRYVENADGTVSCHDVKTCAKVARHTA